MVDAKRFRYMGGYTGDFWLPNPDTPEGHAFYKAQAAGLLESYPHVDGLILWFRRHSTPWLELKVEDLPPKWREDYAAAIRQTPEAKDMWHSVGLFAIGKIVRANQKALRELGRTDVSVGLGTWAFMFLPAADRFMPRDVCLYGLDYAVLGGKSQYAAPDRRAFVAEVARHRDVVPIAWAHHDDGNYVGPPYVPFERFHDCLGEMKCGASGFGIIHWTTRPLDVYFKNMANQVWQLRKNEPVEVTCRRMASDVFGPEHAEALGEYLRQWLTELPRIGRETSDHFIDRQLPGIKQLGPDHRRRMARLGSVDPATLSPEARRLVAYFRGLEHFILDVCRNENSLRRAAEAYGEGQIETARRALGKCDPRATIERYAKTSQLGGGNRGEQGLVVSLNTRWATHYDRLGQQLGIEPIRYNFAPTSHDHLAQVRGTATYYVDAKRNTWMVKGEEEIGTPAYGDLAGRVEEDSPSEATDTWEVLQSGVESGRPIQFEVLPYMDRAGQGRIAAGRYRLTLLFGRPEGVGPGSHVFDVVVSIDDHQEPITRRIDLHRKTAGGPETWSEAFDLVLAKPGPIKVKLTPAQGKALISGLVLEPSDTKQP